MPLSSGLDIEFLAVALGEEGPNQETLRELGA